MCTMRILSVGEWLNFRKEDRLQLMHLYGLLEEDFPLYLEDRHEFETNPNVILNPSDMSVSEVNGSVYWRGPKVYALVSTLRNKPVCLSKERRWIPLIWFEKYFQPPIQ